MKLQMINAHTMTPSPPSPLFTPRRRNAAFSSTQSSATMEDKGGQPPAGAGVAVDAVIPQPSHESKSSLIDAPSDPRGHAGADISTHGPELINMEGEVPSGATNDVGEQNEANRVQSTSDRAFSVATGVGYTSHGPRLVTEDEVSCKKKSKVGLNAPTPIKVERFNPPKRSPVKLRRSISDS